MWSYSVQPSMGGWGRGLTSLPLVHRTPGTANVVIKYTAVTLALHGGHRRQGGMQTPGTQWELTQCPFLLPFLPLGSQSNNSTEILSRAVLRQRMLQSAPTLTRHLLHFCPSHYLSPGLPSEGHTVKCCNEYIPDSCHRQETFHYTIADWQLHR